MNHNLYTAYKDTCSPPQNPFLAFFSPESESLLFDDGDEICLWVQAGLRSLDLSWRLHRNRIETPFLAGVEESRPGNRFIITLPTNDLPPGFYDLRVTLETGMPAPGDARSAQRPVEGICTFGWQVNAMPIATSRPKDFRRFWDGAKAQLEQVPLQAEELPLDSFSGEAIDQYNREHAALPGRWNPGGIRCETVESGKVSFAAADGGRVYGWLAKPKGKGPFPAMLVLPGAGFGARPRPLEHARHGYLALDIQVHGQDVDQEDYPILPGYSEGQQYDTPAAHYYYYHVHLRCVQAVRYLLSRPDVDPERLVVAGGSQGGRLGIVTAALDARVKAVVCCIINSPNVPHLRWVDACNRQRVDGMDRVGAPPVPDDAESRCMAYYDPMNFAPEITCPVLMNAGLIDPVSPPFSPWAVYQGLRSTDQTIVPLPGLGHDWSAAFDRQAWRWLAERMPVRELSEELA